MSLALVMFASSFVATSALVCTPQLCEGVTQPVLNCTGGVIKGGGFCHCTDVCAKLEGEFCQAEFLHGFLNNLGYCDTDLHCERDPSLLLGGGRCVKDPPADVPIRRSNLLQVKRDTARTLCEQRRLSALMTMVVWEGKWIPKCAENGDFLPMQCDNTNHCFCVNVQTGEVIEGTKVLGAAQC